MRHNCCAIRSRANRSVSSRIGERWGFKGSISGLVFDLINNFSPHERSVIRAPPFNVRYFERWPQLFSEAVRDYGIFLFLKHRIGCEADLAIFD